MVANVLVVEKAFQTIIYLDKRMTWWDVAFRWNLRRTGLDYHLEQGECYGGRAGDCSRLGRNKHAYDWGEYEEKTADQRCKMEKKKRGDEPQGETCWLCSVRSALDLKLCVVPRAKFWCEAPRCWLALLMGVSDEPSQTMDCDLDRWFSWRGALWAFREKLSRTCNLSSVNSEIELGLIFAIGRQLSTFSELLADFLRLV